MTGTPATPQPSREQYETAVGRYIRWKAEERRLLATMRAGRKLYGNFTYTAENDTKIGGVVDCRRSVYVVPNRELLVDAIVAAEVIESNRQGGQDIIRSLDDLKLILATLVQGVPVRSLQGVCTRLPGFDALRAFMEASDPNGDEGLEYVYGTPEVDFRTAPPVEGQSEYAEPPAKASSAGPVKVHDGSDPPLSAGD